MKQNRTVFVYLPVLLTTIGFNVKAEVSSTVTLVSDYLFNGVSQTDKNPALQASLDWSNEHGLYAGAWGSNVDFGDDTELEVDGYLGFGDKFTESTWYDVGVAYYGYFGAGYSSDLNYYEVYGALGYNNTSVKLWYSPDYAGSEAKHYVIALNHSFNLSENLTVNLQVDKSQSLDESLFSWEENDKNYIHWKTEAQYQWQGFDLAVGVEGTDLDTYGDTRFVVKVGRTFSF